MKRWRALFPALAVAGVAIACGPSFLDGISGGAIQDKDDAGKPTGTDASTCDSRIAPDRPPVTDMDSNALILPVFAVSTLRIDSQTGGGDDAGVAPLGRDQDLTCSICTNTGRANESCVRPADAGANLTCDGPRGEDNALASLFGLLNNAIQTFPRTFATDRIRLGYFTILIEFNGWNGKPDDSQVSFTLRDSQGMDAQNPDGGRKLPLFDGKDLWSVSPDSVSGGDGADGTDCRDKPLPCAAKIRDDFAFVTGGTLVAHPSTGQGPVPLRLRSALGTIALDFYDLTVTAKINGPTGGPYTLQGELSGRLSASNVLTTFANLEDFTAGDPPHPPICRDQILFGYAKSNTCAYVDLAPLGQDNTNAPCSFLSAAISFSASAAQVGTIIRKESPVLPCDAGYSCN